MIFRLGQSMYRDIKSLTQNTPVFEGNKLFD